MSINLQSLKEIENELESYTQANAQLSKIKAIRKLYHRLEEALDNGLTIQLLCDYLNQKGLEISPNYLYLVLHRIRKERGNESNSKAIKTITKENHAYPTPPISSSISEEPTETQINPYDLMMEKYKQCDNQVDKYIALGGKREDIEEQNISTQRGMVMTLRNQLRQKYKGIY
ncbi:hypothetical protein ACV970_004590 [Vibrio parahaemolyticus]|uniref:hypothetical protein n=1 Tax=Vibrio parahaemolyticus TaxID=670 RepID=UPI00079FF10A|nr:hypothetical protein [Vibrio parahaemolyticus]EGQ8399446.1 hypothetical protein [Vibrio parahaemolyticus]EGQ9147775.1 hypothetical protein [Vibrio parahaemolyticus]EGR0987901.1 hypothetical protein [Vibrio parahaemolyticus]EGR1374222.1 hypothetical protein [Vibrio parahaemolyticus]EHY8973418.1 hypothetical protein [Vibrio parahaemolyticus]